MIDSSPSKKSRHGCLTAYLVLVIVVNSGVALFYLWGTGILKRAFPSAPPWLFVLMAFLNLFNLVFAIALFRWKKWGFWGFCGTTAIALVLNILLGMGIWATLNGVLGVIILYAILQIGTNNKGWSQLE